ncbi:hypothetical protein H0E87_028750 [Populus deltoides]|uniref:Uncharacterized protein n=1 Tax=Populus deltoides TaxID=3696 RepID=A0A8T2WU91_POPDE|nr:hypothetical protein H0E87_028750 [Populus deltoides]
MATSQNRAHSVLIFVLFCISSVSSATEPDVYCLKSIKDSLEDPYNHSSLWDFANQTEGFIWPVPSHRHQRTSLTGLDLSRNELQGPIPSDIPKRLPYITYLDQSFNNFSGEIPPSIADLSYLNVLKLDHNQLIGNIPPQIGLLHRLKNFSVADNRTGFAAGYTVFSVSVIVGFVSCCVPWVRVKKRNKKITIQAMVMLILRKNRKEADHLSASPSVENIHGGGKEISMLEKKVPRMSYTDLKDATNNFSENNDFEPKLSNFGEAIIVNPTNTSSVNGEFWDTAFAKEDVYGFGVVLLELITGVDSSRMTGSSNSLLNEWISHLLTSSKIYDAIDKSLVGQGFDDEIFQLLKVACQCVDSIPDRRPTTHQVYKDIRAMRERCRQIDDSEILVQAR